MEEERDAPSTEPEEFEGYCVRDMVLAHQASIIVHASFNTFTEGAKSTEMITKTTGDAAVFKNMAATGCNKVSAYTFISSCAVERRWSAVERGGGCMLCVV